MSIQYNEYHGKHLAPEEKKEPKIQAPATDKPIEKTIEKPTAEMPEEERRQEKPIKARKRMSTGLRIALGIFAVLALLFAGAVCFISVKLGKMNFDDVRSTVTDSISSAASKLDSSFEEKRSSQKEKEVYNILLIGVDNDNLAGLNDLGNADGIMLLSVNTKTKQVVLTSIMRDISIKIPDKYSTKITLVYHDLGTEALISTIEYNFDIIIDNYALVNYLNVIEIINALGGLELEINETEIAVMNGKIENLNTLTGDPAGTDILSASDAGVKLLNGKQVAALLRIRNDGGNDQMRTERARRVILAAKDKVADMSLAELNSFSDIVLQNITTDVSTTQALGLLVKVPAYLKYEFVSNRIPLEGTYTGDGSFIYIDYDANTEALHKAIYGDAA